MTRHGQLYLRDTAPPRFRFPARGRFGRLFRWAPAFAKDTPTVREALKTLGAPRGIMDPEPTPQSNPFNPAIPAGFTFLGQFIDHDLTFDPTSSLERQSDPNAIENFRTPAFELDSMYGAGPAANPLLYDKNDPAKLLIDADRPHDLPRNSQERALLGDPRNDENLIVSQLHLAFIKFHNAVVDELKKQGVSSSKLFDEAQKMVRWHYQWIVLHEFLPLIAGKTVTESVLQRGRRFYGWNWRREPYIPVEFSVAAYRFGHSQVRPGYTINAGFGAGLFGNPDRDLSGGRRLDPARTIDWSNFFVLKEGVKPQESQRIDTTLSRPLFDLPGSVTSNPPPSLAERNLLRHLTFGLPSGQTVARRMGITPLSAADLADVAAIDAGLAKSTPLWFYILREADKRADGASLGPVGGRIVAEVFIGLMQADELSFLSKDPCWTPTLGEGGDFKMADLLRFARVADAPNLPTSPAEAPAQPAEAAQPAEVAAS